MHFHRDGTRGRIARLVLYRDIDRAFQRVICTCLAGIGVGRSFSGEPVLVRHLPCVIGTLLYTGHRDLHTVHRDGRVLVVDVRSVFDLQLDLLLIIAGQRDGSIFTVQVHIERAVSRPAMLLMLAGARIRQRALVHSDGPIVHRHRRDGRCRDGLTYHADSITVAVFQGQLERIVIGRAAHIPVRTRVGELALFLVIRQLLTLLGAVGDKRDFAIFAIKELKLPIFTTRHVNAELPAVDLHDDLGRSAFILSRDIRTELEIFQPVRIGPPTDLENYRRGSIVEELVTIFRHEIDLVRYHRPVVMHRHHQRAGSHIAGGIRHRNIDAVRKSVICADGTSTPHIIVSLLLGQLICVFNLPRTAGRLLRGSRHRYLDAVHRQCCVGGKPCLVERIAVDQAQGNGRVLPSAVLQRNGAVFAVQIHGKRVLTGNAVHYMLTGTIGKRAFIHHDLGFVFSRRHRLLLIAPDGDGQRRFRRIAVRIHDGVGEGFRNARVLLYIHVLVQLVGIGTVRVQRQLAVGAFQRATDLAFHAVMLDRGHRIGQVIRTGLVILQHIAHDPLLRLGFLPYDGIVNSRRRIIHHVHRDGRAAAVAVRIRHGHDQGMGDLRVRIGIALDVFRGVPVEPVAEVQLARGRVITRHRQGAFIRAHDLTGQRAVLEYHHAADDDGRHTVRSVDAQGASGHGGRILLPSLRTACQAGFIDRHHLRGRTDTGRRHGHTMIDFRVRAGLHRICGKLRAAIKTDVQAPQMVKAVQQVAAAVFVIAAAARGAAAGGRTGGGHQVFVKGGEEVLPADLHAVHLEGGHLFLGIGGIEPLQLDGSAILKGQDKIVAIAGQRRRVRGKIKDEAPVRSAGDGLRGTSSRLGKTDIGHEGPPETCMIFQKNL